MRDKFFALIGVLVYFYLKYLIYVSNIKNCVWFLKANRILIESLHQCFCSTGLGWVSVLIFQKTGFSVGFWVFSKLKKNWRTSLKFSGKIVLKKEKKN
jgi:hypothetical protein